MVDSITLDSDDVLALKKATHVVFYKNTSGVGIRVGLDMSRIQPTRSQKVFPETSYITSDRLRVMGTEQEAHPTGLASIGSAQFSNTWGTTVSFLRKGDTIRVIFKKDHHTTPAMQEVGLHADVCQLRVTRGKRVLVFNVVHSTCPDNSARMVKPGHENVFI